MTTTFGVSVPDELADQIEAPLEYGDSRSERVAELVALGLAVEEAAESTGIPIPENDRDKTALLRQAFTDLE